MVGETNANLNTTQAVPLSYYRCQVTCGATTLPSGGVRVDALVNALIGAYSVNPSLPTGGANFQSLNNALQVINCAGISGAVILNVAPGTYSGNFTIGNFAGAIAGLTITSATGNPADVVFSNGGAGNTFAIDGATSVTLTGISIINSLAPTVASAGVFINSSSNIAVTNCIISGNNGSTVVNNRAIYATNSQSLLIIGNVISNAYYGIYHVGAASPNYSVANQYIANTITNCFYYGIYLTNHALSQVEANKISDFQPNVSSHGIYLGRSQDMTIGNNEIYGSIGIYGIYMTNVNVSATAGGKNLVYNNVISGDFSSTTPRAIYFLASSTDGRDQATFVHNSIELRTASTSTAANGAVFFTGGSATAPLFSNLELLNNAIKIIRPGAGTNMASVYMPGDYIKDSLVSNNNLFFFDGTNPAGEFRIGAINYALAAWRTFTSQDVNSVVGDPLYISATNLAPLSVSPLKDAASVLPYVFVDIVGNSRGTTPDIGAYEIQTTNNDILMVDFISPASTSPGATPLTVAARFKNVGTTPLTGAVFSYQFANDPVVTQVFTGNIVPQDTGIVTFTTTLSIPLGISGELRVWSSAPNGQPDPTPSNDTIRQVMCQPLGAGTYTVGNPTADFPDFTLLSDVLNCGGVSGPVTFLLDGLNNLISGQLQLGLVPGASAINTITFNGQGDTLSSSGSVTAPHVVVLSGAKHIRLQNMFIRAEGTTSGVLLQDVEDIRLVNNTIFINLSVTGATTAGILASGSLTSATIATTAKDVVIDSNNIIGGYYGIRFNGAAASKIENVQITNSQITDFYFYGIYTLQAEHFLIDNNDISRPTRPTVSTFYGIYNAAGARRVNLSRNRIHTTHGPGASSTSYAAYGIYYVGATGDSLAPNVVSNNMLYNFNSLTGAIYGIYVTGGAFVHVYHNTLVFDDAASTAGLVYANYFLGTGTNHAFKNNITVVSRAGTGAKYCLYITGTNNIPVSNRNVLAMLSTGGTTNSVGYFTTGFTTLANWQTANGGAFDQNSVSVDPLFVNQATFNFTPSAFQVNNLGENLTAVVATDIFGVFRTTTPDPGAIEFNAAGQDAGIGNISILLNGVPTPIPNGCLASLSNPLSIQVANAGADTLPNIAVSYRLNNQAVVTETVVGPIAPGTIVNHVFSAPLVLSNGIDTITAWVYIANDGNRANDTAQVIANNYLTTIAQVPFYEDYNSGSLPMSACVAQGVTSKVEVLGTVGANNLAINGSHSLVMSGSAAGAGWLTATATNWTTVNPGFNSSLTYYVDASTLSRLAVSFKLRQLFRGTALSAGFQLLVNDQAVAPIGFTSPVLRAANAAASNDTLNLRYDLDAFVGDTVKITLFSSVRYDYTGTPIHGNIIDELNIFQPTEVAFDSVTVIGNTCTAGPKPVAAFMRSASPITSASLKYGFNAGTTQTATMTFNATNNSWNATLPAAAAGDSVTYWIEATNATGVSVSSLSRFKEVFLAFSLGNDTTILPGSSLTLFANVGSGTAPDSLFGGVANNGSGAVMFEVMANKNVLIDAMDFYFSGTSTISIYVKTGTFVGSESNAAAWTLLNTISVTGAGTTIPVRANLPVPINVPANQMTGIYIFGSGVRYIGTSALPATVGQIWQTNGTLTLYGGIGGGTLFSGGANSGRTFAGHLYYLGADSLAWTDGANFLGNVDTLLVTPTTTTTYYCTRFANGCSFTDTITVFVNPLVTDDIGISAILSPVCIPSLGTPVTVKAVIQNFGQTPVTGFDVAFSVNGVELNANAISRTVLPGDTIHHTFSQSWTPAAGPQPSLCIYTKGLSTDINSSNDTSCMLVPTCLSIENLSTLLSKVYPNPANDEVYFELQSPADNNTRLVLLDPVGKVVQRIKLDADQKLVRIALNSLAPGMYSYRLERQSEVGHGKLMIVK